MMGTPREIVCKFAAIAKKCPRFVIPPDFLDTMIAGDLETNIMIGMFSPLLSINHYRYAMDNPYAVANAVGVQTAEIRANVVMDVGTGCVIVSTDGNKYVVNHDQRTIHHIYIDNKDDHSTEVMITKYFAKLQTAGYSINILSKAKYSALAYHDHVRTNNIRNQSDLYRDDWNYCLTDIHENMYIVAMWACSPDIQHELLQFASIVGVGRVLQAVHMIYETEVQPLIRIANSGLHEKFRLEAKNSHKTFLHRYCEPKHMIIPATFAKIINLVDKIITEFIHGRGVSRFLAGVLGLTQELYGVIKPGELIALLSKYVHITGDFCPKFACEVISDMHVDPNILSQICAEIQGAPLEKYEQVQLLIQDIIDEINIPEYGEIFAIWDRYVNQPIDGHDFGTALPKKSEVLPN